MKMNSCLRPAFNSVLVFFTFFYFTQLPAAGSGEEDLFESPTKPNVLIILDNSNSMDEDFYGNAVGSYRTGSKSVEGKKVLNTIIGSYSDKMRLGLMTYKLPLDTSKQYLTNVLYFASYEPKSYCPSPPDECVDYCRTGSESARLTCQAACQSQNPLFDAPYIDDSITGYSYSADPAAPRHKYCGLVYPKTNRLVNPTDPGNYIYYKQALPFYDGTQQPASAFWVSPAYVADDVGGTSIPYDLYRTKTGTSDGVAAGYADYFWSYNVIPTDSDIALGYNEFGRRQAAFDAGRTFFSNGSPGGGYLHIPVADNLPGNAQKDSLLNRLRTLENDEAGYMDTCAVFDRNQCDYILNAGLTPTAGTLQSAIHYFQGNYPGFSSPIPSGPMGTCQKNYIVYLTDGLPSVNESGVTGSAVSLMSAVLQKLDVLRALGYGGRTYDIQTYIVGLGLTAEAKAQLDRMAVRGGTAVGGNAFYADDPDQLRAALQSIFGAITQATYSFGPGSVSAVRSTDDNAIYQGSFKPSLEDPFWKGQLKKYNIKDDGSIGTLAWDAGEKLKARGEGSRQIWTYQDENLMPFDGPGTPRAGQAWSIWEKNLDVRNSSDAQSIVMYIRGDSSYNADNWKLGDMFHSSVVTIGAPSPYFVDVPSSAAYESFRENHKTRERIIVGGFNDGQFRAFSASSGEEKWSFVPPNLMPKLQYLAHGSHGSTLPGHMYFVDGPVTAADVWLGSGNGTSKSASEWKTLLVFGEGKGVRDLTNSTPNYLWSSARSCDMNDADEEFSPTYDSTHPYYCGYWAFEITDTSRTKPTFKWMLHPSSSQAPYLGEPWSRMRVGRVRIGGEEKWVGFFGAGFGTGTQGKGFFVVSLSDGDILWSFTKGASDTRTTSTSMTFSIPASPAIVDSDSDGFVDTAYIGDLGGNIWRLKFCTRQDGTGCGTLNWSGEKFFSGSSSNPVYTTPSVARDDSHRWVFWGTGDTQNPLGTGDQLFLGVKDDSRSGTYNISQLQDISGSIFNNVREGWFINFPGGEKVLADSAVFGGMLTWTTFTPSTADPCIKTGRSKLYALAMVPVAIEGVVYKTGAGLFLTTPGNVVGQRSVDLGLVGIAQVPVFSQKPGEAAPTDTYITTSGAVGADATVVASSSLPDGPFKRHLKDTTPTGQILHWWDQRVQPH